MKGNPIYCIIRIEKVTRRCSSPMPQCCCTVEARGEVYGYLYSSRLLPDSASAFPLLIDKAGKARCTYYVEVQGTRQH